MSEEDYLIFGRSKVRFAVISSAIAVLIQFSFFFIPSIANGHWLGEHGLIFIFLSILYLIGLLFFTILLWAYAFEVLLFISNIFRAILANSINPKEWDQTTCYALWPLPIVFTTGAIIYMSYFLFTYTQWFTFSGHPFDIIYGIIGNALGAFCYLVIFKSWFVLIKQLKTQK